MKRSKLIPILKSFSKEEIKEFDKFLNSPFFGCKKFVLNFYRTLIMYHPSFNEEDIAKEKLFDNLYKGRPFNAALIRRMTSDLIFFSEEYLKYKNFKSNDTYQSSSILNELRKRKLDRMFINKFDKIMQELNSDDIIDYEKLLKIYFIQTEMTQLRISIRDKKMNESLRESIEALTVLFQRVFFSYINHLKSFSSEISLKSGIITDFYENFKYNEYMKSGSVSESKYSKYLKLIHLCHKVITDGEDKAGYNELKKFLNENKKNLTAHEKESCYNVMSRFCNYQNMNHENIFAEESFNIYDTLLKEKYFLNSSNFLQLTFCRNVIVICKTLKRTNYIKSFIKEYEEYFSPEYKDDLINFANAVIAFENNKFERSLEFINKSDVDKAIFKKDLKILKLKIFYELKYYESLHPEIDSFKHYFSAERPLKPVIIYKSKQFIKYLQQILKLTENPDEVSLNLLKKKIQSEKLINEKQWLIAKIEQVENEM